jgi:hypothetical protein
MALHAKRFVEGRRAQKVPGNNAADQLGASLLVFRVLSDEMPACSPHV